MGFSNTPQDETIILLAILLKRPKEGTNKSTNLTLVGRKRVKRDT